jgi:hypothetical protein
MGRLGAALEPVDLQFAAVEVHLLPFQVGYFFDVRKPCLNPGRLGEVRTQKGGRVLARSDTCQRSQHGVGVTC